MIKLGVNIDHIATLRQARGGFEPEPLKGALIAEKSGADGITVHLREDRRHIQDADIFKIKEAITIAMNLEMAANPEITSIALKLRPYMATIVPEKRQEITTEGGLDVINHFSQVAETIRALKSAGIVTSLFIEPDEAQIDASKKAGAEYIEIHTGCYANSSGAELDEELKRIISATAYASNIGLLVNAGHGLNYENVIPIAKIPGMRELNIGHSIISQAVFTGLSEAVREMKKLLSC